MAFVISSSIAKLLWIVIIMDVEGKLDTGGYNTPCDHVDDDQKSMHTTACNSKMGAIAVRADDEGGAAVADGDAGGQHRPDLSTVRCTGSEACGFGHAETVSKEGGDEGHLVV